MGAIVMQFSITIFLSVLIFMVAYAIVWPSYALKILESPDSPLGYSITRSDGNLIGSISMLGSVAAILIIGYVNEKIGGKRTEILCGLCFTLAWSLIATAKSVTQLVIGRFLIGFGAGMHLVTSLVFISEISQPSVRGALMAGVTFMYNIGTLVSYIVGWFCSYQFINYLILTIAVVFVVAVSFIKETPIYLLRKGKEKEALKSLKFYRGTTSATQEILDELVYLRNQQQSCDNNDDKDGNNTKVEMEKLNQERSSEPQTKITEQSPWKILRTSKSSQRAIIVLSTHMMLSVCMGMIGVQTYAGQFFRQAVPDISADLCSVILAIVFVITSAVTVVITDMIPRRVLMISSCLLSAASLVLLASMLRWSWAPVLCIPLMIIMFSIFFQVGAINVPFVQISECLSPQIRSFGTTVTMLSMYLGNFVILYIFEPVLSVLGLDGLFFMFSIISVFTAFVAYFLMKETRKVPIEEVQDMFEQGYLYRKR